VFVIVEQYADDIGERPRWAADTFGAETPAKRERSMRWSDGHGEGPTLRGGEQQQHTGSTSAMKRSPFRDAHSPLLRRRAGAGLREREGR
jgi:hypothetical protein